MKSKIALLLLIVAAFAGCETTQNVLATVKNWALGVYKATPQQVAIADNRATEAYEALPEPKKTEMKQTGQHYLAVRTADPNAEQMAQIKKEMKKPGSRYGGGGSKMPSKVYCVMIWDSYSKEVVGNNCYATAKLPAPLETAKFDSYTALYVGSIE